MCRFLRIITAKTAAIIIEESPRSGWAPDDIDLES